jgi:hypothetical protein
LKGSLKKHIDAVHLKLREHACSYLANAVAQRAAWALALPALSYSVSEPHRWAGGNQMQRMRFW